MKSVVSSQSGLYTMSMAVPRQNGEKNDLLMLELYENCSDFPGYIRFRLAGCQTNIPFITPYLCAGHHQRVLHSLSCARRRRSGGDKLISKYVPEKSEKGTIIGVMKDFKKYSLTNNVFPLRMIRTKCHKITIPH